MKNVLLARVQLFVSSPEKNPAIKIFIEAPLQIPIPIKSFKKKEIKRIKRSKF